ncbi:PQ-loop repeat family protein / transmembrane family protein [Melia azedarach]|uniref:PQ-loop repeat family protein / transmembrane family protein n=2 Tax=Melia azedarach TaxID=155640 RepID=A0ACC1X690_MELAZ|nr:PQ-loop repeat family protein / transmembrane family protein [Melia azedarach]KAJ4705706.1 PQ-loop repeat family protein / transmembrane family protein [Melia azedarach]
MGVFRSATAVCPSNLHCAEWARIYMGYCLCSVKDGVSLTLGLASVISWGVAEIPQIVTNYKQKSTEGLSIAFLTTWIVGDLFNLFGCMLEPATLPTQYYMAILYTLTTVILTAQTIYYGHIYPRLKENRRPQKGLKPNQIDSAEKTGQRFNGVGRHVNSCGKWTIVSDTYDRESVSTPIPLPAFPQNESPGRELYYMSARSLSRSHTPTAGSFLAQRMSPSSHHARLSIAEPLLGAGVSTQSAPSINTKSMLCLVSVMIFLGTFNLHHSNTEHKKVFEKSNRGFVVQVRRKLLQVSGGHFLESVTDGSSGIGSFLGWAMAAIYMGGRLPQICLNIRRGNVEGLNPLMFVFALVGNATYVGSILVSSLEWLKIRPNLPWLVDAGGCVLLDSFILIQFIYFRCSSSEEDKHENSNSA